MAPEIRDDLGAPNGGWVPSAQAFSDDGSRLASGRYAGTIKLWDSATGGGQGIGGGLGGGGATPGGRPTSPQLGGFDGSKAGPGKQEDNTKSAGEKLYTYRNDQPASTSAPASRPGFNMGVPPFGNIKPGYFKPGEVTALPASQSVTGDRKAADRKEETDDKSGATVAKEEGKANQPNTKPERQQKPGSQEPAAPRKIIIRSGDIEFEIESFDAAVATITKLVSDIKGGFVATVNSDKLANGKVRGSVVVRVPPERLDTLILDLRKELGKGGELKGLHVGSQDITKQYTDLESRLKAARTMEERLLQIIKAGKGEIKDLLQAAR
jgi:hypothetical protein